MINLVGSYSVNIKHYFEYIDLSANKSDNIPSFNPTVLKDFFVINTVSY